MRYFDTKNRTETRVKNSTTLPMSDARVTKFFFPLENGEKMIFGDDDLPYFFKDDFVKPTVINGSVVEGETPEEALSIAKSKKLLDLKFAKKEVQLRPVKVRELFFNGGREAGQKYDEALRLALKINKMRETATGVKLIAKGNFGTADGSIIELDETYADEVIVAVAGVTYLSWAKEQGYIAQVSSATTLEEVDAVVWQNEE